MNRVLAMTVWRPRRRRGAQAKQRPKVDKRQPADKRLPDPAPLRRWALRIAALLLLLALAVGAWALWHWLRSPTTLPIRNVAVSGAMTHVPGAQLRKVVDEHLPSGFFGVDLNAIAVALDALPWVAQADVRRVWPNGLAIRIEEQHAVARWNGDGLLNAAGTVFRPPPSTFPKGLPDLAGPQGKELELMSRYATVSKLFGQIGLRVVALRENARRAFSLRLDNGIEVVIGRHWSMQRMARMVAVYRHVLANKATDIKRIDLRYTNGFAVAWKSSAAQAAAASGRH